MNILMVCLGNICRSPLAEGILADKAAKAGFNWLIDSAGTSGYHIGEPPHVLSRQTAASHGIDISHQRGRQFTKEDMQRFNRIFVMDEENFWEVRRMAGSEWDETKVSLILELLYPGEKREVPDPWYGTQKDFQFVYDLLDKACDALINSFAAENT
ncbi:MAG: low molecular weight phosphotyrosine protein phosphatase [Bacteroidota bacterium]|nr:low molecular weight phosphotyrosine protein phosphatase [Bacteroidota bacterium]